MRKRNLNYFNMLKEEKNPEMSRQFEDIFNEYQDPILREKRRRKLEKEKKLKETKEDLGL